MSLSFLVPGRLDQLTGGYLYDRHIVEGLRARGRAVDVVELPGRYPDADAATREAATAALASMPDGGTVIIDGLALPGLEDCLADEAQRLRLIGLIHHPLSMETGLDSASAARHAALESALWPLLKGAICPSAHTARAIMGSGLPTSRVAVVAPGTHRPRGSGLEHDEIIRQSRGETLGQDGGAASRPSQRPPPLRLLSVGSITPRKGHLLLVEAVGSPGTELEFAL